MASALLLVCALTVAVTWIVPAGADVALQAWSAGDFWVYTTFGLGNSFNIPDGTKLNYSVAGLDSIDFRGVSYPTFHVTISFPSLQNATSGSTSFRRLEGDAWYNESDLSLLRMTYRVWQNGAGGCLSCWANASETWTAGPPLAPRFPLRTGFGWFASTTVNIRTLDLDTGALVAETNQSAFGTFTVGSNLSVGVPAGTFTTTPMTENLTKNGQWAGIGANPLLPLTFAAKTVAFYSPLVGNAVCVADVGWGQGCGGVSATDGFELVSYGHSVPASAGKVFGMSYLEWGIIALAVVAAFVAVTRLVRRRPPRVTEEPTQATSPSETTTESHLGPKE